MSRTVLIILAALAAVIVIGVLGWGFFLKPNAEVEGAPRIAIVTDDLLEAAADAEDRAEERNTERLALFSQVQQEGVRVIQQGGGAGAAPAAPGSDAPPPSGTPTSAGQAAYLRAALSDELEAQINKMLTSSRRFAVIDQSSVRTAIAQLSVVSTTEGQEESDKEKSKSALDKGVEAAQGLLQGSQTQTTTTGTSGSEVMSVVNRVERGNLAGAAEQLDARYLLAVSLQEPKVTREYALTGEDVVVRYEADPVFVYRMFDVVARRSVLSDSTQLGQPVVVEVAIPATYWTSSVSQTNFMAEQTKAWRELSTKVQERVARHIADAVLEARFPATLVSTAPLTMSRGSNDGVEEGEVVYVSRRGAEIKDGDIVIDYEESPVGAARVIGVKENSAQLEATSGTGFTRGDIVRRSGVSGATATTVAGGGGGSGRGLGREDVLSNRANTNAIRERVAVSTIRLFGDSRISSAALQIDRALSTRLARDPRIEVMSRESLGALANERAVGGARKTYERGGVGVAQAGYVVLGDVTVNVRRNAQYIEVPGAAKREVSASTNLVANGSLRIERLDSRIIDSFEVSASAPVSGNSSDPESARRIAEAFADAAASAILPRLFPMEVVQVQGTTVVLNRGEDVGMKVGATFAVYAIGDPIIDSTTGAQISAGVRRKVGTVRIDDVQRNVSVATIVGDGGAIAVGQIAEVAPASPSSARRPAATSEKKSEEPAVPF